MRQTCFCLLYSILRLDVYNHSSFYINKNKIILSADANRKEKFSKSFQKYSFKNLKNRRKKITKFFL